MPKSNLKAVLLLLATLLPSSVSQAQSFVLRRSTGAPGETKTAPVRDSATRAPFRDASGVLDDGLSHYYLVENSAGAAVRISVNKHLALRTVQIGFDDADPASADVDAALSSVIAQNSSIPADGITRAVVVIVPRDASGTPLGTGLDVTVDLSALLPGFPAEEVVDRGNGEYVLYVRSWNVGGGTVVVSVEGRILADTPQLTYTAPVMPLGPVGELLQIGSALQAIIDANPAAGFADELAKTVQEILKAVAELQKTPPDDERAADKIKRANDQLDHAWDHGLDAPTSELYLAQLTAVGRYLAVRNINAAIAAGGNPSKIQEALTKLAEGDALRAAGSYEAAAAKYKEAIGKAEDAQ